jgi:hypothetical protein
MPVAMMPTLIPQGTVLTVEHAAASGLLELVDDGGARYRLRVGPAEGPRAQHAAPKAGDRLVVMRDSAPNGDTLVVAECRCSILLVAAP